jgi:hypothetical protein
LQAYKIKEQGAYIGVPPKSNDTTTWFIFQAIMYWGYTLNTKH